MPAFRPSGQKQIVPSPDGEPIGERRGSRRGKQLINQKGIARYDDLLTARFLEQTPTVSLPMNTAMKQARSVPISIEATVEDPTTTHEMMADRILEFIDGGFNSNNETWDELLGLLLNDSLSIDTAPLEFVPTADTIEHPQTGEQMHWLSEVWFVDGSIVSKNLDAKDRLPMPPEPAYFKWGNVPNAHSRILSQFRDSDLFDQFTLVRLQRSARRKAVPMTRDELAIMETNRQPPELSAYGRGVVQQVRPWAEILMNQDRANVRHFADDEFAKGILNIGEQYAGEIETFREYWDDEVMGQTDHSLPKIASSNVEFIPFNESLKELQYLESQTWYSKLVWMLFGEATSTVGLAEDANYSTVEGQKEDVFVHTTVPRLKAIEEFINNHWLPKMREYWIADAELEFRFKIEEHPIMADAERQKRRDDLNNGLTTPNRVLESEDRDPVPWGDVPSAAVSAFAREHPEWVMEHWGGIENVPEPASESGGLFDYTPSKARSESKDEKLITSETTEPATPDEHDSVTKDTPEGIPDEAYPVDDAGECEGSVQEGPQGGLYCVPPGVDPGDDGDGDDEPQDPEQTNEDVTEIVENGTHEELESYVSEHTGVESVTLPEMGNEDAQRRLASSLSHAGETGLTSNVDEISTRGGDEAGMFNYNDNRLEINENLDESELSGQDDEGFAVGDDTEWLVLHELGHANHADVLDNDLDRAQELFDQGLAVDSDGEWVGRERVDLVDDEVSTYGRSSAGEFIAEVFSGLALGMEFSDDVMDIYEEFDGPDTWRDYQGDSE